MLRDIEGSLSLTVRLFVNFPPTASRLLFLQIPLLSWEPELSSLPAKILSCTVSASGTSPLKHDHGYSATFMLSFRLPASR